MCGFVGCFGKVDKRVNFAGTLISHRGPNDQKYLEGSDWSIKFNRLSIIDLSSSAMQPFSKDGVDVYVNGEIYNYIELKNKYKNEFEFSTSSDIEIIPFLYLKYGMKFLNLLNGMFSMILVDNKKSKKYLVRDRFGKKPLYYYKRDSLVYFSSEIKAFKSFTKLEIDKDNLAISFIANLNPEPITPYKSIYSVLPGHFYEFSDKVLKKKRWYFPKINEEIKDFDKIKKDFDDLSSSSIDYRLRSDVPIGVFLSGGLDSNLIFKKAFEKNKNITAFVCKIPDKDGISKNLTDVDIPKKICKEFSCKYKEITFDLDYLKKNLIQILHDYDLLISGTGHLIFHALSKEAKHNNTKVILTGSGGDEISGGYYWQRKAHFIPNSLFSSKRLKILSVIDKVFKFFFFKKNKFLIKIYKLYQLLLKPNLFHMESHGINTSFLMKEAYFKVEKKMEDLYEKYLEISSDVFFRKNLYNNFEYRNIFLTIANQNHFFDISTMSSSIENRAPLLDFRIVEYMFSISKKTKNSKGLKYLYKKLLSHILPSFLVNSKKSGPSLPINIWLKKDEKFKKDFSHFLKKNSYYIKDYLSKDLAANLEDNDIENLDPDFLIRFRLFCLIIWIKIKIDNTIQDPSISLEELFKN